MTLGRCPLSNVWLGCRGQCHQRHVWELRLPKGGDASLSIKKHDHYTPARMMRRDVRALTARDQGVGGQRLLQKGVCQGRVVGTETVLAVAVSAIRGTSGNCVCPRGRSSEREFAIDNLMVRIHLIIEMIWWTGLALWEFKFPFPNSLSTLLEFIVKMGLSRSGGQDENG